MHKRRILVVDDEVSFTRLLKLNLERTQQYEVRVENWAEDAFKSVCEFRPDLIILDVIMPRMAGGDVVGQIKTHPGFKKLPILFLSAAISRHRVKEHGGVLNGFPFLAKPASLDEVIHGIESSLASTHRPEGRSMPCSNEPVAEAAAVSTAV